MPKVLVTTFTNMPGRVLDSFRQGFVDALAREGNDVLVLRTNDFLADCQSSNKVSESINQGELLAEILRFEPDIVFSMNHSGLFEGGSSSLDCPICIWLLDGPSYLVDPQECKRQAQRYHMLIPVRAFKGDLKDGFGFRDELIHYVPFASDFRAFDLARDHNIAFVGTHFTGHRLQETIQDNIEDAEMIQKIRQLIESYKLNRDQLFAERLEQCGISDLFQDDFDEAFVLNTVAINNRIKTLVAVEPLGLTLFGSPEWVKVMPFSIELALSYNPRLVLTQLDLESIYNSSRVNLNISHAQARGGLPWRVFDIMACNGVLVSDYQEDLSLLFGDLDLPIYNSAAEARDLCSIYLKDEPRRQHLAQASQQVIQSSHRLLNRIISISEATGVCLRSGNAGSLRLLSADAFPAEIHITKGRQKNGMPATPRTLRDVGFLLQLFHSDRLEFSPQESLLADIFPSRDGRIQHDFRLPNSKTFLRLDIGEQFSRHKDFVAKISLEDADGGISRTIDLRNEIIASHQFSFVDSRLICGFDAYCVVENPFPARTIIVTVETTIEESLWGSDQQCIRSEFVQ